MQRHGVSQVHEEIKLGATFIDTLDTFIKINYYF